MFRKIKNYYDNKLWTLKQVWDVVGKAITPEEYFEITGFVYPYMGEQVPT